MIYLMFIQFNKIIFTVILKFKFLFVNWTVNSKRWYDFFIKKNDFFKFYRFINLSFVLTYSSVRWWGTEDPIRTHTLCLLVSLSGWTLFFWGLLPLLISLCLESMLNFSLISKWWIARRGIFHVWRKRSIGQMLLSF